MIKNTSAKITEIKQYGYTLDFGDVFSQAFENYKKVALLVGCILLVLVIVFAVLIGGIAGVAFGVGNLAGYFTGIENAQHNTTALVINFLVAIIGAGLVAPLTAGILKICHCAETNQEFGFGTAFDYYKTEYFKELFTAAIIITFVTSGSDLLVKLLLEAQDFGSARVFFQLFNILIAILASIFTLLTLPLIVFGNLKAVEAIKGSFIVVLKRFWMVLILLFVGIICSLVGLFGLCIGIFFTLPFYTSIEYMIYRNAVGIEEANELDEIGNFEL